MSVTSSRTWSTVAGPPRWSRYWRTRPCCRTTCTFRSAFARDESEDHYEAVAELQDSWAFVRKEAGLGRNKTSKWICPAMAGKAVCTARDPERVRANQLLENPLPVITPPDDWTTRKCCVNKTLDFTPDPTNPHHQRKLMQREYYGSRRWRHAFNLRSFVEGAFGILKNPSRLRIRRGHNRIPGLAMANLINALKVALFSEEQLRAWHERTGLGPAEHPLLQPDPYDWGITSLTKADAQTMDRDYLSSISNPGTVVPLHPTDPDRHPEEDTEGDIAA